MPHCAQDHTQDPHPPSGAAVPRQSHLHLRCLQHAPVYTIGKRGSEQDFRVDMREVLAAHAEVVPVPRGGETTYHGPGQLIAYPIVSLRHLGLGARAYVEALEDAMVAVAGRYGLAARVSKGHLCSCTALVHATAGGVRCRKSACAPALPWS